MTCNRRVPFRIPCSRLLLYLLAELCGSGVVAAQQRWPTVDIPKTWDEKALADWAIPLAGINVRPSHISSAQYYALPADNLKTWPVYLRGGEPEGYWQMLQTVGPQPMIEPERLKSEADWIKAGRIVFEQMDHLHLRTLDPAFVEIVRRGDLLVPLPNGTAANVRWVPTKDGVALGFLNCAGCHQLITQKDDVIDGAPTFATAVQRAGPPLQLWSDRIRHNATWTAVLRFEWDRDPSECGCTAPLVFRGSKTTSTRSSRT